MRGFLRLKCSRAPGSRPSPLKQPAVLRKTSQTNLSARNKLDWGVPHGEPPVFPREATHKHTQVPPSQVTRVSLWSCLSRFFAGSSFQKSSACQAVKHPSRATRSGRCLSGEDGHPRFLQEHVMLRRRMAVGRRGRRWSCLSTWSTMLGGGLYRGLAFVHGGALRLCDGVLATRGSWRRGMSKKKYRRWG